MISLKLTVLGDILLGVWIVILLRSSDCVAHGLHDCYTFDGLYIEGVFRDPSSVALSKWVLIGPYVWRVEWTTIAVCRSMTWRSKVWLQRVWCRVRRKSPVWTLEWMLGTFVLRT